MILSGKSIQTLLGEKIYIDPFVESRLNPNSYNLTLHNELLMYENMPLDMKQANSTKKITIPSRGFELQQNTLYLGRTVEYTKTYDYVPMLEGRSSIGRLGLCVHITSGFGDVGFEGYWTLEMYCVHPTIIYPNIDICQIFYHSIQGDYESYYSNKYQKNKGIQASLLYKDFE